MKIENINEAEEEARKFLLKVKMLKERLKNEKYLLWGCSESGALRRSSLDLSKALALMRKP